MLIIKNGAVAEDNYQIVREPMSDGFKGDVIVSLAVWRAEREALAAHDGAVAIMLASDEAPTEIADDLDQFSLVALEFPAYRDGRAYSYARLLRDRYGYAGEVRAVGDVLRDQYFYMARCGFDAFEVKDAGAAEAWRGAMGEMSVAYQRASDARIAAYEARAAAGRAAPDAA